MKKLIIILGLVILASPFLMGQNNSFNFTVNQIMYYGEGVSINNTPTNTFSTGQYEFYNLETDLYVVEDGDPTLSFEINSTAYQEVEGYNFLSHQVTTYKDGLPVLGEVYYIDLPLRSNNLQIIIILEDNNKFILDTNQSLTDD